MKKVLLTSALLLSVCFFSYGKIWRVNNNNGIKADFTTIQAAHNGASSGDTLHVEGSANSYGSFQSTKKLIIIGPGYFLNFNSSLQALTQTARIDNINYYPGSEGSVIMGMELPGGGIYIYCNDIVVKRNRFSSQNGDNQEWNVGGVFVYYNQTNSSIPANNIIISQNYALLVRVDYPSTGVLITNNYLTTPGYYGDDYSTLQSNANAVLLVQNNIFKKGKVILSNSNVTNNIMMAGVLEGTGNLLSNNLGSGTQFGTVSGNKSNIDMGTVFVATGSPDGYYKLKSGSPASGAGYGSTTQNPVDAGMFGGNTPYVLSGIPPVPSVYFFENQPVGSSSDPIDVTVKVRSNN